MRYIPMEEAQAGMCLGYTLFDSYGRALIHSGSILTEQYIMKLEGYGFDGIYIDDEISKGIEIEPAISPELRMQGMAYVREMNIDKCKDVAKDIVGEILKKGIVSLDLMDLRTYDDYTYAHSVNVAVLCCAIGFGMKMNQMKMESLVLAALLHDFGKQFIDSDILNKKGRLTQEEYQIMKSHAERSYEMIKERIDLSAQIKTAVLHHHENIDGSGYPKGISGEEQTLFTRILHVADVYDALISKRPYKNPYSPMEAAEYLMGACGIQFDMLVVDVLLKYIPLYQKGTKVVLNDGREGIIVENYGIHNLCPIIRLFDGQELDLSDATCLTLQIVNETEEELQVARRSEEERQKMITPLQEYHIMVVDDIKTNLQVLRGILENQYKITALKSGQQALGYLKNYPAPDLIILDIDMPVMDGIETTKRIQKQLDKEIPILYVTAVSDMETVLKCRKMNAAGYILRPYNPTFLKAEMDRILTGRRDTE